MGNRVVKRPKSDSSKLRFLVFYSIVNTPTKKKPQQKGPARSPVPDFKVKTLEKVFLFLGCERVNFGLKYLESCSKFFQHIYTHLKSFLVSFSVVFGVYDNLIRFVDLKLKVKT